MWGRAKTLPMHMKKCSSDPYHLLTEQFSRTGCPSLSSLLFSGMQHIVTATRTGQHHAIEFLASQMEGAPECLSGLSHCRNNAKLLQHTQTVEVGPRLDDLAASDAVNGDPRDGGRLVRGRHAKQTPGVRALRCPAGHHPLPFGKLILNGDT